MEKKGEALMLNVHAATTVGIVSDVKGDTIVCQLKLPVCIMPNARITLSRRIGNRFRLIGYGIAKDE
ncbi:MAG: hypothetical protein QW594_04550 [Candidatus Woesearchaeota archaeon]